MTCEHCRSFLSYDKSKGYCKRYPPQTAVRMTGKGFRGGDIGHTFKLPEIHINDFCNEFKYKKSFLLRFISRMTGKRG